MRTVAMAVDCMSLAPKRWKKYTGRAMSSRPTAMLRYEMSVVSMSVLFVFYVCLFFVVNGGWAAFGWQEWQPMWAKGIGSTRGWLCATASSHSR